MLHHGLRPKSLLSHNDAISEHLVLRPSIAGPNPNNDSDAISTYPRHAFRHSEPMPVRNSSYKNAITGAAYDGYEVPNPTPTSWESERHEKGLSRRSMLSTFQTQSDVFERLPREVYDWVVVQLEQLHLGQYQSCPSCYLKDLYNLSLTSRAWDRAAKLLMYDRIWVVGNVDHPRTPKLRITGISRLKLLRRTLRERNTLARLVCELHMPDFQALYYDATIEREEIVNHVASLVMVCPNLERLVGFHIPYTHSFDRLSHALSTKRHIKERVWFLANEEADDHEDDEDDPTRAYYHEARDPTECFLELNSNHDELTTLLLHQDVCPPITTELTFRAIIGTLRDFTALRHLSLSGFSRSSFSNIALNALPINLSSLRLENLPGINDKGLQRFATSRAATTLESVLLLDLELEDLTTVSLFLSPHLLHLRKFSLAQFQSPEILPDADFPEFLPLALEYIHWEIRSQASPPPTLFAPFGSRDDTLFPSPNSDPIASLATSLLASDIRNGLFPLLRTIRAPHDPQGVLQALCKPLATALLPPNASFFTNLPRTAYTRPVSAPVEPNRTDKWSLKEFLSTAPTSVRTDSALNSPMLNKFVDMPNASEEQLHTPLSTVPTPARSRLAAQSRIIAARKEPFMSANIRDAKGALRLSKTINGFLGDVNSSIIYDMRPDRDLVADVGEYEGVNEWITDIGDVMGEWDVVGFAGFGSCRHSANGRIGGNTVNVQDMF